VRLRRVSGSSRSAERRGVPSAKRDRSASGEIDRAGRFEANHELQARRIQNAPRVRLENKGPHGQGLRVDSGLKKRWQEIVGRGGGATRGSLLCKAGGGAIASGCMATLTTRWTLRFCFTWLTSLGGLIAASGEPGPGPGPEPGPGPTLAAVTQHHLPVVFQKSGPATFAARGNGFGLRIGSEGVAVRMGVAPEAEVRLMFIGASDGARFCGEQLLPGRVNEISSRTASEWRVNQETFASVRALGLYPGVDLVFHGSDRELEFDYVVAPGADPSPILLGLNGATALHLTADGAAVAQVGALGEVRLKAPTLYQDGPQGREAVEGAFRLAAGERALGFHIGSYDHSRPLIIDPIIHTAFVGGTANERPSRVAVDADGAIYISGATRSLPVDGFPTLNALDATHGNPGGDDIFVTKIAPDGSTVLWSTYFGGNGDEHSAGVVVDAMGRATIAGSTESTDLPLVNALVFERQGFESIFVAKLAADGQSLVFSTYYCSGFAQAGGYGGIAGLPDGTVAVTGTCGYMAPTIPFTSTRYRALSRGYDVLVLKLTPTGGLSYSAAICGIQSDHGAGIALDASGRIYLAAMTLSDSAEEMPSYLSLGTMPIVSPPGGGAPIQLSKRGQMDGFIAHLDPATDRIVWSTMLGGVGNDWPQAIALDPQENVFVTGTVDSNLDWMGALLAPQFPTTPGAFQSGQPSRELTTVTGGSVVWSAGTSSFLTKIDHSGAAIAFSTMFGGRGAPRVDGAIYDSPRGVTYPADLVVNASGEATVAGYTTSPELPQECGGTTPTFPPSDVTLRHAPELSTPTTFGQDAFLARFTSTGRGLVYSTLLGTEGADQGSGVALTANGDALVLGRTARADRGWDAFLTRVHFVIGDLAIAIADAPDPASPNGTVTYTVTVTNLVNASVVDATATATLSALVDPDTPFSFTLGSIALSQGSHSVNALGNRVTFHLGTMAPLGTATLTLPVHLTGSSAAVGTLMCVGAVSSTGTCEARPIDNTATASTTINGTPVTTVDLDVTVAPVGPFASGQPGQWALSVRNLGTGPAHAVVLTGVLSEPTVFSGSRPAVGSLSQAPGTALEYVQSLYRDILLRSLDSAGQTSYVNPIVAGSQTRESTANALMLTTEARQKRVAGWFMDTLRAAGTASQVSSAANLFSFGFSSPMILRTQCVGTSGYFSRFGGTNLNFARAAYLDLVGRPVDAVNEAALLGRLNGGQPLTKAVEHIQGLYEYREHVLDGWFQRYLGRASTVAERGLHTPSLIGDQMWEPVLAQVLATPEYWAKSSRTLTWDIGSLPAGGSATAVILVTVRPQYTGPLSHSASVTFSGIDVALANNSATAAVAVGASTPVPLESVRLEEPFAGFAVEGGLTTRVVEASADLSVWTVVMTLPAGTPRTHFREWLPPGTVHRYYRVRDL
jgi:Domain of unknown function (DUF4214)/Domain of unknown function DUF11/Beta-propeller repeat